jgi:uncharacterized protein
MNIPGKSMQKVTHFLMLILLVVVLAACGAATPGPEATATVPPEAAAGTPGPEPSATAATATATEAAPAAPGEAGLQERAQLLVELLAREEHEQATGMFDAKMAEVLPADQLGEIWQSLLVQAGDFEGILGTRTGTRQGYRLVFVTLAFARATLDAQIAFDDADQVAGLFFVPTEATPEPADYYVPPNYVQQEAFVEREVTVGQGQWVLPATLTLPQGDGPFPGLVLVHGSGPSDRDETVGFYKPFRDLAWGLASQGIAVLRYEKRTQAYPEQLAAIQDEITVQEETIDDALAAVALVREVAEIDRERVYLLGHSLGAMLVPRIGAQDPDIEGFVVLAGAARPLEDLFLEQMNYIFGVDGQISDEEQAALEAIEVQVGRVKDADLSPSTPASELPLGVPARYWLDLRGYAPADAARDLAMPLLILHGGRDYQVTQEDFDLWKAALSDRQDVEFGYYPDLNHFFVEGEGMGSPEEDYATAGNVAAQVIHDIAAWIKTH